MNEPADNPQRDPIATRRLKAVAARGTLHKSASQHQVEPQGDVEPYPVQPSAEEGLGLKQPRTPALGSGTEAEQADYGERHVSLLGLFALVTLAGAVLAMRSWLAPPAFAGIAGMLVLGYLFLRSLLDLRGAVYTWGGWLLVILYAVAVVMAVRPPR